MKHIAGIDLSTASTGVACIAVARPGESYVRLERIRSAPEKTRGQIGNPTLTQRRTRMRRTADQILTAVIGGPRDHAHVPGSPLPLGADLDLVVIESPSFGSSGESGTWDRAGLWWQVVDGLYAAGVRVLELGPMKVRKSATGSAATNGPNKVTKDMVLAATVRRYVDVDVDGNDVADALLLAAMGARLLRHPIEASLPAANLAAIKDVHLPAEWSKPE